jgi:2-phospho-L-lactate guanylyltransferase
MTTWAIVPVKPLHKSKSRLSNVLSADDRFALMQEMFLHVMGILRQIATLDEILVVSKDATILDLANGFGVQTFSKENPSNLNGAVGKSAEFAWENGAQSIVVLPADLAMLDVSGVELLLTTPARVVICPDERFDGTNALLLRDLPDFTFRYGDESFQKHLGEAARLDLVAQVVYSPSIEFDLDTPADLQRYRHAVLQPI